MAAVSSDGPRRADLEAYIEVNRVPAGLLWANPLLRWKGLMLPEPEKQVRVVEENEFAKLLEACENPSLRGLLAVEKHYSGDVSPVYRQAMDRIAGVKTA
ncbi:MAG: hypothetical protein ISS74_05550 [Planctomycetes bacterium]|nr:hypothetical protein [Planctomycetota bacterium]